MKNRIVRTKHAELVRSTTLERDLRWMQERECQGVLTGESAILEDIRKEQDRLLKKSFEVMSHLDHHIRFQSPEPCWQS